MLKPRIITAIISLVILLAVLFVVPAMVAKIIISIVLLVGAWEWSGFLSFKSNNTRYGYVFVIAALMAFTVSVLDGYSSQVLQVACVWWSVAFIWTFFFPTAIPIIFRWICGALVLVPLFVALLELYALSPQFLLLALIIVWAADMGAYFAGKYFGRVKLAPSISPAKTWEGVLGGLAMVVPIAFVWAHYTDHKILVILPFCLAIGTLSVVGDLTVSMFKRTAGLKDSGTLLPGHGGILDRVDSIAAAAPFFALGIIWLGLL
ncbi:MAG: phosphatidate cytidylyltransferase [Woeseiaceae bacterium]|nr:phosphatidate cytidylyltransferase [Woeseiaceae bacterium]|tara:strand:- start:397 stop:1182 length:786 start_codon:yes stop_codon:yes gene_type:complete